MNWDSWFRRRRWERRMDTEFRFHLESLAQEYMNQGLAREAAELQARREFGAVELAKDECRDERRAESLDLILRDIRCACRSLRRTPGFTLTAIVTLALGIGATTAIFSVVHKALLKPLPYSHPEQLYSVEVVIPGRVGQEASLPPTVQAFLDWRSAATAFSDVAALRPWECNLTRDGEPERLGGARVSTNFFALLGVPMKAGRGFIGEEEQPGKDKVVVLSESLWRRRYGADPAVIGRSIDINGDSLLVVGIAPASLLVPTGTLLHAAVPFAPRVDLWRPIAPTARELRSESWDHGVLVRLERGQNAERGRQQLQARLNSLLRAEAPELNTEFRTKLVPFREVYAGRIRLRLQLLFAAAVLLLLTACTNIANLLLARAASRAGEFATRLALGAGRNRIASQIIAETAVLAFAGGALAAWIGASGARLLVAYGPDELRSLPDTGLNWTMFWFALALSLVVGLVCGLVPAWHACRGDAASRLRESARGALGGGRAVRLRQLLAAVEIACSTVLLASAALLLHSFIHVMKAGRGYDVERVLAVDLSLFGSRYASGGSRTAFYRALSERIREIPGVLAAGSISDLPATSGSSGGSRTVFYSTDTDFQRQVLTRPVAMIRSVTAGYFSASGTSLRAGRYFDTREAAPVALLSESLASLLWPGEQAAAIVGRTFRQGDVTSSLITIVGIVEDVRPGAVDRDAPPVIYRPHEQWASGPATLVVKTSGESHLLAAAVRVEIRKMDASLPIGAIRPMREIVSNAVAPRRFQMMLTSAFALLALVLAAVGVYGVVSYSISSRIRDIGLRLALGATRADILYWILAQGIRPVLMGLAAGLVAAIAVARTLRTLLFGIGPADPIALGAVALLLLFTAGLACYLPARRGAALDPMTAIRHE